MAGDALFLLNSLEVGGSERKTVAIANALCRKGWPVHLGYLNAPETLASEIDPSVPTICLRRRGKLDWQAVRRLRHYVSERGIESIHCINHYPLIYGYLAAPGGKGYRPHFTAWLNTTIHPNRFEQSKMIVYRPLLKRAKRIVFGCRRQRGDWVAHYRLHGGRCDYIYNGVDVERFDPDALVTDQGHLRSTLQFGRSDIVVGMVGQLRPKKGYRNLLAACAQLHRAGWPIKVLIVGEGPERDRLRQYADEQGMTQSVRFVGAMSDVRPALLAMDIFVLTSTSVETFSNAALEAMSMRRPVILSDIGGAAEMVDDGIDGLLYPADSPAALSHKLTELVADPAMRERLGAQARCKVMERFSFERMVAAYESTLFGEHPTVTLRSKEVLGA